MEHVTHEGYLYELIERATPESWDARAGELIARHGRFYLLHEVEVVDPTRRLKRLARALLKSVASILILVHIRKTRSHWEGAWSGREIIRIAHAVEESIR